MKYFLAVIIITLSSVVVAQDRCLHSRSIADLDPLNSDRFKIIGDAQGGR